MHAREFRHWPQHLFDRASYAQRIPGGRTKYAFRVQEIGRANGTCVHGVSANHSIGASDLQGRVLNDRKLYSNVEPVFDGPDPRSEERRVGKECVRTWRSRWSRVHKKK